MCDVFSNWFLSLTCHLLLQTKPKLGISQFPKDIVGIPDATARTLGPIAFQKFHDAGGHFAAWEKPGVLVQDLRDMFAPGGGAHGVVRANVAVEGKIS